MGIPEKLPQNLAQLIAQIIFVRTMAAPYRQQERFSYRDLPLDPGNFDKWSASLLGLYVSSDGSADPGQTIEVALYRYLRIINEHRFHLEASYFGSLASTFIALTIATAPPLVVARCFLEARTFLDRAKRKDGNSELCRWCEDMVLKAQRTCLDAHDHTETFIWIMAKASSYSSHEEHDSSEMAMVGFEDLIKFLDKEAHKLYRMNPCYGRNANQECTVSEDEVSDETSDEVLEFTDEDYSQWMIQTGEIVEPYNMNGLDADTEKTHMEVHKPVAMEQTLDKLSSSPPNEEGTQQCHSTDAMEEFHNSLLAGKAAVETYKDGRDADAEKMYMEVDNTASSEQTTVGVSSSAPNEVGTQQCNSCDAMEQYDNSLLAGKEAAETYKDVYDADGICYWYKEMVKTMKAERFLLVADLDHFEDFPNVGIQMSYTEVHKPATYETAMDDVSSTSSNDEQQNRVKKTFAEIKDFTLFLIFEEFRRSLEATYAKGSSDADKLTQWGAALLGLSLTMSGQAATDNLNLAISKLKEALAINSDYADALCYISNAYAALFWLTCDFSKSNWYFDQAKEYIQKAVDEDPAEPLFLESMAVISTLMEAKKELTKKRKLRDAFGEDV